MKVIILLQILFTAGATLFAVDVIFIASRKQRTEGSKKNDNNVMALDHSYDCTKSEKKSSESNDQQLADVKRLLYGIGTLLILVGAALFRNF